MVECGVCLEDLASPSAFGAGEREPDPVSTLCGHLFHKVCLLKSGENGNVNCPICRQEDEALFPFRIFPTKTTEVEQIMEKLKAVELERDQAILSNEELRQQVAQLKKETYLSAARIRENGARIGLDTSCADATCKNCESKDHKSRACPNPPYLRNRDVTEHDQYFPAGKFSYIGKLPGSPAGEIIAKYESKFGMEFSRSQIQVVYGFVFFDHVCFGCFSPFHDLRDCRARRDRDPGAKKVARMMQDENHPPSSSQIEKRIVKKNIYGKH